MGRESVSPDSFIIPLLGFRGNIDSKIAPIPGENWRRSINSVRWAVEPELDLKVQGWFESCWRIVSQPKFGLFERDGGEGVNGAYEPNA